MKKSCISLILALLVLVIMLPAGAMAKELHLTAISGTGVGTGTGETTFKVEGTSVQGKLREILANSYGCLNTTDQAVLAERLLQNGDTIVLPEGTFSTGSSATTVYGNITIKGQGSDKTTLINTQRMFDLNNRYSSNFEDGTIYTFKLQGFTAKSTDEDNSRYGIYLTGNNIKAVLTDVAVEGFADHCIGIWSNEISGTEVGKRSGMSLELYNVKTAGKGADLKLEACRSIDANGNALASTRLIFDEASEFSSTNSKNKATDCIEVDNKEIYVILQDINDNRKNNPRVNNMYVLSDGTLVPANPPAAPVAHSAPVDMPQTGDNSMLMLWTAVCAMAIAVFAGMKKRRIN